MTNSTMKNKNVRKIGTFPLVYHNVNLQKPNMAKRMSNLFVM